MLKEKEALAQKEADDIAYEAERVRIHEMRLRGELPEEEEEKPAPKKEEKKKEDEICDIPKSKNNFVDQISKDALLGDGIENDTDYEDAIIEFTSASFGEANGIIRDFKL